MVRNVSIIDADSIIHIVASSFQVNKETLKFMQLEDGGEDIEAINELYKQGFDVKVVLDRVGSFISDILTVTEADCYLGYIANEAKSHTFRHDIAVTKPYKGKRPPTSSQVRYWKPLMTEYMVKEWGFHRISDIEVDDACTVAHTKFSKDPNYTSTICSPDKDLKQIEGKLYNYSEKEFFHISNQEANRALYTQLLVGDSSDNIPGLKGVGKKSKLLQAFDGCKNFIDFNNYVRKCYYDKGQTDEYFREQLTLLYMARTEKYLIAACGYKFEEGVLEPTPFGKVIVTSTGGEFDQKETPLPGFLCPDN